MSSLLHKLTDNSEGGKHLPWISRKVMAFINGYDHQKYWSRREKIVNPQSGTCKLLKMYYLFWIKRVDNKHHCSFGTSYNTGSQFVTPPLFATWPQWDYCWWRCQDWEGMYYIPSSNHSRR